MLVFYTGYSQIHHCLSLHINRDAYKVACLGVTEGDWRALAMEAMEVNYMYMTLIYLILTQGVMPELSPRVKWVEASIDLWRDVTINCKFCLWWEVQYFAITTYIITLSHFGEKKFINVFDDLFRAWILIQLKRYCVQCCVLSTYFGCWFPANLLEVWNLERW